MKVGNVVIGALFYGLVVGSDGNLWINWDDNGTYPWVNLGVP
jgi:hypothetical protein